MNITYLLCGALAGGLVHGLFSTVAGRRWVRVHRGGYQLQGGCLQGANAKSVDIYSGVEGCLVAGAPFRSKEMFVAGYVVPACFHVLMDYVWSYGANFDQPIMLNENGVTGQISVQDRWITSYMKVARKENLN